MTIVYGERLPWCQSIIATSALDGALLWSLPIIMVIVALVTQWRRKTATRYETSMPSGASPTLRKPNDASRLLRPNTRWCAEMIAGPAYLPCSATPGRGAGTGKRDPAEGGEPRRFPPSCSRSLADAGWSTNHGGASTEIVSPC